MKIHRKNRIKSLREKKGWRQLDLARFLDLFQSDVSSIERGEREPGVYLAKHIAKVFKKKVEDIF